MEPQPLADGIRVRSNTLGPSGLSHHPRAHSHAQPPPLVAASKPSKPWGGPFLSGPSVSSAGVAAAVTDAMAANGVAGVMDGATANAFLAALAGRANGSASGGHFAAAAAHRALS